MVSGLLILLIEVLLTFVILKTPVCKQSVQSLLSMDLMTWLSRLQPVPVQSNRLQSLFMSVWVRSLQQLNLSARPSST